MRFGLAISMLLHASLLLFVAYGLPRLAEPLELKEEPLLIELVTIGEETTPQAPPTPEPKPAAEAKAEATPEPKEEAPKEAPLPPPAVAAAPPPPKLALAQPPQPPQLEKPPPAAAQPKAAEPPPPPPAPLPKLESKPPSAPEPPKLSLATPPPDTAPAPSPKPPPPTPKPAAAAPTPAVPNVPKPPPGKVFEKQTLGRIAALLDKSREPGPRATVREEKPDHRSAPQGPPAIASGREQREMTIREIDALVLTIKKQIQSCWTVPAGARDAENLVVRVHILLNPDGSLIGPPEVVNQGGLLAADEFFQTAAESARRAVLACSPLKNLPVDAYDQWREVTLNFNPKEMLQ